MNQKLQFCGVSGLVLIVFGLIAKFLVAYDTIGISEIHIFAGILLLFLFLATGGLQILRSATVRRRAGFGAGVTLYSALFVGVLIMVNFIAARHEFLHYDSTEEQVYTLAPQTKKVLAALEEPIVLRGFFLGGRAEPEIDDLLKRIVRETPNVSWEVVDPEKNPLLIERFGISEAGTIHFSFADQRKDRSVKISREASEQEIVNAILKLTHGGDKVIYYLTGHGEPGLADGTEQGYLFLKESVEGENLNMRELVLAQTRAVPEDADALVLAAAEKALLPFEREAISNYLKAGGNAVLLHEPRKTEDIRAIAAEFGIVVGQDAVVDQVVRLFAGPGLGVQPMVQDYGSHPITEDFSEGTLFSLVSSVRGKEPAEDVEITELARTSDKSWAETNLDLLFGEESAAVFDERDIRGPIPIAVALNGVGNKTAENGDAAQANPSRPGRIVVVGDADFVTNVYIRELFNRDFFLNSLNWAIGEEERVSIRQRSLRASVKGVTADQFNVMFLLTSVLFPEVLLIAGLALWWARKN